MVKVGHDKAIIIENYLKATGRDFKWYLASSLEIDTIFIGYHLEGMLFPENNTRYLELTSGIDKALTVMIQYQNELGDDYRLLIPTKTPTEYNELISEVERYADA